MSTNRPNASIWDDDEGEAQLRPMMRKNNAHLFDDEPPVSSLSAASAASAAAAVAGYTASSAAEANAASALSAPSAYSVGSASSALSARSAGSAHSAVSASSAAVPSAASAAAPEAAGAAVSAPTPDSAGSAPLSARSGATPDATPSAASAQSGAPNAASAPAMPPSQAPKSAPSAPVNGPVLGTTPSVHVPASSLANNGVPAMLANTPPATGRRYTNAENAHTSGTFDSAARRATATTAATSATASTGASALTAASAAAASVTAQSPASATSANAPELADAVKPAVSDAGAAKSDAANSAVTNSATANSAAQGASAASASEPASAASAGAASNPQASTAGPRSGAVRRRSLFTAVPQPVPVDEDGDDETIQVPVVREDLIPDSFSAASAVSASAASASATSAAESASAAETTSAALSSGEDAAGDAVAPATTSPAPAAAPTATAATTSAAATPAPETAAAQSPESAASVKPKTPAPSSQAATQEAAEQEAKGTQEVEAAAIPLPTDFDAPSAISIPTPPHTVSSALSADSTFSIDSAVSAASAASSAGIILPTPAAPVKATPPVPVTTAAPAPVTTSPATGSKASRLSDLPAPSEPDPSEPAPAADVADLPAPPAPTGHAASAFTSDDEVVASDHTETTIMDPADMELEEVVKPVVTSTSPVGVERLDHLATADSADLAPVAPSPSSAIFASTRTAAFSDSANQSDSGDDVDDDVLLAGSTVVGKPASRAAAHWGGTLLALVLFPIAWFLMHTAANALTGALADGWPKVFSTAGIIELAMAVVLLIVVMATATRSSLGTFVTGITTLLIGLPFVVVPSITKQYLGDFLANMALQSRFGRILSEAILLDGVSGRLVIIGLFLIMLGVVSHSTRRAGRRERLVMDRANTKK